MSDTHSQVIELLRADHERLIGLLALLLLRKTPVPMDNVVAALWGENPPASANSWRLISSPSTDGAYDSADGSKPGDS